MQKRRMRAETYDSRCMLEDPEWLARLLSVSVGPVVRVRVECVTGCYRCMHNDRVVKMRVVRVYSVLMLMS